MNKIKKQTSHVKVRKKHRCTFPNLIQGIKNTWAVKELRDKLLITAGLILLFRLGCSLPVPFIDASTLTSMFNNGTVLTYLNMVSGGALSACAFFALGVSPYINSSIIIQLLCVCSDKLAALQKDDDPDGKKKLDKLTQYVAAGFSLVMSIGYYAIVRNMGALKYTAGFSGTMSAIVITALFWAGAQITVWIGGRIDEYGIGNGISLLIFAGILSRWNSFISIFNNIRIRGMIFTKLWYAAIPILIIVMIAALLMVVYFDIAETQIPVQYSSAGGQTAKYTGAASSIPVKVMQTGVMPIIFASSICSIPSTIAMAIGQTAHPAMYKALSSFNYTSWVYCVIYLLMILFFNHYYVEIQYDPIEMANNIRSHGGTITGIRPGKSTSDYIAQTTRRTTNIGAICLLLVAGIPMLLSNILGISAQLGGTSLLILVGVAIETERSMEGYTVMRHHKGFLS